MILPSSNFVRRTRRVLASLLFWTRGFPYAIAAIVAALIAASIGWLCTSPSLSMGINWDAAGYAADISRGTVWGSPPWNSHYGVGHVYWLMMHFMPLVGMTALDGIRASNAIALAWSAVALTFCVRAIGHPARMALVVACLYLTAWGTLILAFTWEDNVLVHPAALTALAICLARIDSWRPRDSVYAGALVGIASLMSWQGAAYIFPAGYAALVAGEGRAWWRRTRDALLVPIGLVIMRTAWVCIFWLSAPKLSLSRLLRIAFERPSPNFLPETLSGWLALLGKPREILVHAGIGVTHELGPGIRDMPGIAAYYPFLGGCLAISGLLLWLIFAVLLRKRTDSKLRFLCVAFLCLTAASIVYLDLPVDKYKRYDYLPAFAAIGISTCFVWIQDRISRSWIRGICSVAVCLLVVAQGIAGYRWNRQWYSRLLASDPTNYTGHKGQTWFSYIRSIRRQPPNACSYIFAFPEVSNGRYQLEIPAALYSELDHPVVIGAPEGAYHWPRPLPLGDINSVKASLHGCEWLSESARGLLTAAPGG